ncbi:ARM repeat-containing protein [Venturia nashicola]|uniref:ARM repeat-containing protein n=1 Tax=Venturia nashicola TaxID=86259 RepID=A0A4Z1NLB2_9PEZI|nr:ARM repeat-containing protein [Venturia nashicola]
MAEKAEEDFSSLPLPDRFAHKNWKVRKEGYEAAARHFDSATSEQDPTVREFINDSGLWKAAAGDSNIAAHQEALGALCSFLQIAGTQGCTRTRSHTVVPIVEKGLAATRPAAKQKALEALLLYIEMDKADPIIEELLPMLSHKQPKIIAATLAALNQIYHAYGVKTVEPKPVLKMLPKMYGHADKNVRAEASNLTVELYRWLREAMKPLFWNDLKPVQQTDLEKLFEKVKDEPAPKQERLLKSQQAILDVAPIAGTEEGVYEDEDEEVAIDLEPEYVAVDVMSKIPKDLQERLSSSKWKDRKDALDDLYTAINYPKIDDGQFGDIMQSLAKCMKDANIAVVTIAAGCIEIFARGLMKGFAKYRGTVMGAMMERLKEKKQAVTDALGLALDAVFAASNGFADCLEEMLEFLKHKNPQVKLESTRFLIRCLQTTREAPHQPEAKSIADASSKLLTESSAPQRDAGAEVLGTLWKIMGDRIMNSHMEGLDDIRKTKIKEFHDKAEVKAKFKPKPVAPPPKAAPPAQKRPVGKKPPAGLKRSAPTAPARAPSPVEEPPPALAARPSTRPASKLAPKAGSGLKPPGGLQKRIPGPYAAQSPAQRRIVSPTMEEEAPPIAQPKLGVRGLAGRPIAKPASRAMSPEYAPTASHSNPGISVAERAELEELRLEIERLRRENEQIRQEKGKLSNHVHELTNQNAQLIEDHTRDVLSIKAKETQLVRARSDEEEARQSANQAQREIDRLKRELSRQVRASSPAPMDISEQIYNDGSQQGNDYGAPLRFRGSRSYVTSPTESIGKENFMEHPPSLRSKLSSPPLTGPASRTGSAMDFGSGSTSPLRRGGYEAPLDGEMSASRSSSQVRQTGAPERNGQGGAESWRRAAEVTQNLKARIEMMKAKQGLSRPH